MSINNSTRSIAHVPITNAALGLNNSQYKRRIEQVEGKSYTYQKDQEEVQDASKKAGKDHSKSYSSAAQELFTSVSSTFNELKDLTNYRLNPIAFANIHSEPDSRFNNVDLKRHQNYFNQMMNFDTPAGSWIDISG